MRRTICSSADFGGDTDPKPHPQEPSPWPNGGRRSSSCPASSWPGRTSRASRAAAATRAEFIALSAARLRRCRTRRARRWRGPTPSSTPGSRKRGRMSIGPRTQPRRDRARARGAGGADRRAPLRARRRPDRRSPNAGAGAAGGRTRRRNRSGPRGEACRCLPRPAPEGGAAGAEGAKPPSKDDLAYGAFQRGLLPDGAEAGRAARQSRRSGGADAARARSIRAASACRRI